VPGEDTEVTQCAVGVATAARTTESRLTEGLVGLGSEVRGGRLGLVEEAHGSP
jgi:hypothetical protein